MPSVGCVAGGKWTKCNVPVCTVKVTPSDSGNGTEVDYEPGGVAALDVTIAVVAGLAVVFTCCGVLYWSLRRRHARRRSINNVLHQVVQSRPKIPITSRYSESGTEFTEASSAPKSVDPEKVRLHNAEEDAYVLSTPTDMGLLELKKCLGAGSFAKVWHARWLGADVAVKVMVLKGRPTPLKVHLLNGVEANYLRKITHPNIVQTYHVYKIQDRDMQDKNEVLEFRQAGLDIPNVSEIWMVQVLPPNLIPTVSCPSIPANSGHLLFPSPASPSFPYSLCRFLPAWSHQCALRGDSR